MTLYTDNGCGTVATVSGTVYQDTVIPLGCTNSGSGNQTVGLTADCNPGRFNILSHFTLDAVAFSVLNAHMHAASHLSVSILFSCSVPCFFVTIQGSDLMLRLIVSRSAGHRHELKKNLTED